jgi:tetratricopeptide (TPR) repeat protein
MVKKEVAAEAEKEFKEGLMQYEAGYYARGLTHIQKAAELDAQNPTYLSYTALLVALAHKNYEAAEQLGHAALRMKRNDAQLYLNLAEIYIKAGSKADAVEALEVGLTYTKQDVRLRRALRKLGIRRPPVIPFLERKHFLNRYLGKARHKILVMLGKE